MAQKFPQSCQNWFQRVQTTILMKEKHFWKLIFFEIRANFFPNFGKKYSATLAEVLSKRSDEHFDVQQPLLKNILLFWILAETFSEFSNSCFAKVWKVFSKNWCEHFNQKKSFLKNSQVFSEWDLNIFWFPAKILRKDCQNCYLRFQKEVEETDCSNFLSLFVV